MAKTFHQIYIQAVFAVSRRANLIHPDWQDDLFRYIAGIIKNKEEKPIITGGHLDHIHLLFNLGPSKTVSDLIRDVKNITPASRGSDETYSLFVTKMSPRQAGVLRRIWYIVHTKDSPFSICLGYSPVLQPKNPDPVGMVLLLSG